MRKLLLPLLAVGALGAGAWAATSAADASPQGRLGQVLCNWTPDTCLARQQLDLEAERDKLAAHRARIQEGARIVEEHAATLRQRLDAIRANGALLAQREIDRRARGAATLDYGGRTYGPADVEAQARLWQREQAQFEQILAEDIAARRTQLAEARERVSLAYSRIDSVVQMIAADRQIGPVTRDLARIRGLSAAAAEATREAQALLDPVRSVLELPALPGTPAAPRPAAERPAFDLDGWLRTQAPARIGG